jgi:hypothetical protein
MAPIFGEETMGRRTCWRTKKRKEEQHQVLQQQPCNTFKIGEADV